MTAEVTRKRLRELHRALGIPLRYLDSPRMPFHKEASVLQDADYGREGRLYRLAPPAATAWSELRPHAGRDGVENFLYSGFRSYEF